MLPKLVYIHRCESAAEVEGVAALILVCDVEKHRRAWHFDAVCAWADEEVEATDEELEPTRSDWKRTVKGLEDLDVNDDDDAGCCWLLLRKVTFEKTRLFPTFFSSQPL